MRVEDLTGFDAFLFYGFMTLVAAFIIFAVIYLIWDYFDEKKREKRHDAIMNNLFMALNKFNVLQQRLDTIIRKL